jgi:hypothetical protein
MQAGNGQHMNDPGADVLLPFLISHHGAFPKDQGRGQAGMCWGQRFCQCLLARATYGRQPPREFPRPLPRQPGDTLGRLAHHDHGADPLVAQERCVVEFSRVGRFRWCRQPAYYLDSVSHV